MSGAANESGWMALAETGVAATKHVISNTDALDDLRRWRAQLAHPSSESAVFMDNTTLVSVLRLTEPESAALLTPATLFDLATFATNVVVFDQIHHVASQEVSDAAIKARLGGENVLNSFPIPSDRDPNEGTSGVIHQLWWDSSSYLRSELGSADADGLVATEAHNLRAGWERVLGRGLERVDLFDHDDEIGGRYVSSSGSHLLSYLVEATSVLDERSLWPTPKHPVPGPSLPPAALARFISESNFRGYFNCGLAQLRGLVYSPNAARLPIFGHIVSRGLDVQRQVSAVQLIEKEHRDLVNLYKDEIGISLLLPFFFGAALHGMSRPQDFWPRIAELRKAAKPFRRHLAELNQAIENGDIVRTRKVREALAADSLTIGSMVSFAPIVTVLGAILGFFSVGTVPTILAALVALVGVAKELPGDVRHQLVARLLHPELYFLTDVEARAQHLTKAIPKLTKVWGLSESLGVPFAARFEALAELGRT